MRHPVTLALTAALILVLAGCATPAGGMGASGGAPAASDDAQPTASRSPMSQIGDATARAQAQAWLDAATLPEQAVRSSGSPTSFSSFTGWPCQPVETLTAYWTIPDATVIGTVNWLRQHPTADLVSTAVGEPLADDPTISSQTIGYIPADDSQQGVVYTVEKMDAGVAVRAEVAALTSTSVCPSMGPGEQLGKPGQG